MTLAQSTQFLAIPVEKEEESYCLCENGRKTVAWLVTPKSLGKGLRVLENCKEGFSVLCWVLEQHSVLGSIKAGGLSHLGLFGRKRLADT